MDFINSINAPITSKKVEEKGQRLYKMGKIFMLLGLCAIALFVIIGIVSIAIGADFIDPFVFNIGSKYAFAYPFVIITYIGILLGLVGPFLYISGINCYALGRIAVNTEKD